MDLVIALYELTEQFPRSEIYGLISQMRRAAISIPSNIAEGYRRGSKKDYAHFLSIAHGSLSELETQILLAQSVYSRLQYEKVLALSDETGRMLYGLIKTLKH